MGGERSARPEAAAARERHGDPRGAGERDDGERGEGREGRKGGGKGGGEKREGREGREGGEGCQTKAQAMRGPGLSSRYVSEV